MPTQEASPKGATVTATCKCCKSEFTYTKDPRGGRPQTHCNRACAERFRDKNRSYRVVAAHTKFQKQFINARTHAKRQGLLKKWFHLYAMNLAGMKGGLSDNQLRALTNAYLFKEMPPVADPHANKADSTVKSVYHTFISYVRNTEGIANPYDAKSVMLKAGLIEAGDMDIAEKTPKASSKKDSPELKKAKATAQAPSRPTLSIALPCPAEVKQPLPDVVQQPMAVVKPTENPEPIVQPISESPSHSGFTNEDFALWSKSIKGIKPSTVAVAFSLRIDSNDFTTEADIMRHVATLVQSGNQDAISAMQRYKPD